MSGYHAIQESAFTKCDVDVYAGGTREDNGRVAEIFRVLLAHLPWHRSDIPPSYDYLKVPNTRTGYTAKVHPYKNA